MPLRPKIVGVAVCAVVLTACGGGGDVLASVDGEEITVGLMTALSGRQDSAIDINNDRFIDNPEVGSEPISFRDALGLTIFRLAIRNAAADQFGITVSEEEIASRVEAIPPEGWVNDALAGADAENALLREKVVATLMNAEEGFFETTLTESPQHVTGGCVRHILLGSESEAYAALTRIQAGEEFVAVADELTMDRRSGSGHIGPCPVGFATFVSEFGLAAATAPVGAVSGPVQTEFGYHLILVDQRDDLPSLLQLATDPTSLYPQRVQSDFFVPWLNAAVRSADIEVAPHVGEWSSDGLGIAPRQ